MNSLKEIAKIIKKSNSIAIFTHINPDFDALGSSMSLYYALKKLGKKVELYIKDKLTYQADLLLDASILTSDDCSDKYDLYIATDTPALHRLGDYADIFRNSNNNTIILDHHTNYDLKGKYNFIDVGFSSCSEISFNVIKLLKVKIDPLIATVIYAGLSSDTNSFVNGNTTATSFKNANELTKLGANIVDVNEKLYRTKTKTELKFKKYLYDNLKIVDNIAYCLIDLDTIKLLGGNKSNCSGFSTDLISIENIQYSFSIAEAEQGLYDISFRAKQGFNVNKIAKELGGGGHLCAAGAKIKAENIETLAENILKIIKNQG